MKSSNKSIDNKFENYKKRKQEKQKFLKDHIKKERIKQIDQLEKPDKTSPKNKKKSFTNFPQNDKVEDITKIYKLINNIKPDQVKRENIPQYVKNLKSDDRLKKHLALAHIKILLTNPKIRPIQEVIDNMAVPLFLKFINDTSELQLRSDSIICLNCLLYGTTQQVDALMKYDVLELLDELLEETCLHLLNWIVIGISHLICNNTHYWERFCETDIFEKFRQKLKNSPNFNLKKAIHYAVCTIVASNYFQEIGKSMTNMIFYIANTFIKFKNFNFKAASIRALKSFSNPTIYKYLKSVSFLDQFCHYYSVIALNTKSSPYGEKWTIEANELLIKLTSFELLSSILVENGILAIMTKILHSQTKNSKFSTLQVLNCMKMNEDEFVINIIDEPDLFDSIVLILRQLDEDMAYHAIGIIFNISTNITHCLMKNMLDLRLIQIIKDVLEMYSDIEEIIYISLLSILCMLDKIVAFDLDEDLEAEFKKILFECDMVQMIEDLRLHKSEKISDACKDIMEKFFEAN